MARVQSSIWFLLLIIALINVALSSEFYNETEREYEIFFNRGFKQSRIKSPPGDKSKVDVLGSVLKKHVASLRKTTNKQVELVFLVDSSASVGAENFFNELKFVKKLLADFTVAYNETRVAVITFSSRNRVVKHLDHLTHPSVDNHKCVLLEKQLPKISYSGGGTYTLGAMLQAQEVLEHARETATKAVFLITDGYSNGGDPRPAAKTLRDQGVRVFTFGIQNGNVRELYDMASDPPEEHSYILDSFEEFEALARRALHEDLHIGNYLPQDAEACSRLCPEGKDCCDKEAQCTCGTHTGYYACLCRKGYFGNGLKGDCHPCPPATYWNNSDPGDLSSCLPCPDINHYSEPGSTSPDNCKCKKGYQEVNKQCVVLKCPPLKPPKHGYFVNDYCNNVFNAACGIRCEPGYKLIGSSIRLCAENGSWTGDDAICEMKACPPLSKPRHGSMSCTTENFVFETECHFSCDPGYTLVGSKERTCLAIALWDGLPVLCRSINCPPLPSLINGVITPNKCTQGKSSFGDICQFDCEEGFLLNGPNSKQCIDPGVWSSENIESTCTDVQPPTIKCPENIVVNAEENEASALVKWEVPVAVDNSGDLPIISVVPAIIPPRRFHIGISMIIYIAEDKNKNKNMCNFTVIVRDTQPPIIDKCISPPTFLSREIPVEVTWEEPIFSDNSGGEVTIRRSHEPGYFSLGETSVIYEARDGAGNNSTCIIIINVQEHACTFPSNPINGHTNCTETDKAVYCSLSCKEGYAFAIHPPKSYFCEYNGVWKPEEKIPIPDCSVVELSNSLYQTGIVSVIADGFDCKNSFFVSQVKSHLQHQISNKISKVCNEPIQCSVDQVSIDCDPNKEEDEEENNIISQKKRRSIDLKTFPEHKNAVVEPYSMKLINTSKIDNSRDSPMSKFSHFLQNNKYDKFSDRNYTNTAEFQNYDPLHHVILDLRHKFNSSSQRQLQNEDNLIEVEFELAGNRNSFTEELESNLQQELLDRMETAMNVLKVAAYRGELDLSLGSRRVKIEHLRFKRSDPKFICEPGSVTEGNQCIKCPVGTYFNVLSEFCEGCSLGTYQFQEGQLSCLVCPEHTSTATGQSKSVGECKAQCLPGSFSPTGLEVCETCPRGYYQPNYAQTSCLPCPGSTTTWRRGARREDECQDPCPPGHVSTTGLYPCFSCPIGYFQPAAGEKACYRCPNGATTNIQGSTTVNECAGVNKKVNDDKLTIPLSDLLLVNDCFSVPCLNGATCEALDFGFLCHCVPGFTGIYCENEINECENSPCKNNATCHDLLNGFSCICQPGFSGNLCQKNIDECAYEPCLNGGICTDQVNKFSCTCPDGYAGPICQYNIDDCLSNPCQNEGTCQDLIANYTCQCLRGFTGHNCETNIDDCAHNFCQNNATCIDGIEDYLCQCLPGFRGRLCEDDLNECLSEPCMNGATCLDQIAHFTCLCAPSFTGDLCETELSQDFFLVFPSSGTLDFLQLDGLQHHLDHVTACLWMTTVDKQNYGTPFSYANETADNLFTLTDYNGFVFYINMQEVVTDVTANDGQWHHICVTWSSPTGAWNIYKDGEQADKGTGLAVGTYIPTDGILVVGQEQDGKGCAFSSPESFIGALSLLQIWDYILTPEEISSFTTRCDNYKGNVRAWSDFLGGIHGRVEKKSSDFCRGCSAPVIPEHGEVTVSGVKTNALATYICYPGYKISGSVSRKCMVYGDWSGERPSCSRISCGFPGYLSNGYISGRSYLYQDTIQYFCNAGYQLKGTGIRKCQADGYWNGEPPNCEEILCSTPLPLENGRVITSLRKFKPNHKVQFQCDDGYNLDGASYLICGSDGQWNQSQPVCQPKSCESPPRVLHGQVIGQQQNFDVGSVVYYKCDEGYILNNLNAIKCAIKNRWEGEIPRCERIYCGQPPTVSNANIEGKDHKFGGVVTYRCELGYELVSNGDMSCLASGFWSEPIPHCRPVSCGKLITPENGYIEVTDYTFGNVAKYFCNSGYELQGIRSRKCRATRDWSGEAPLCVPVSCSQPESIPNGKFIGNDWTVGNIVTYSCHPGYTLKGEVERVCLENGQWLHKTPTCEPIECSPPDHVQHARIHGKDYHFGQRVEYQCEVGYELIGKAIRVCLEDQHWGPELPICRPVSCDQLIQIENGEVVTTNNTFTGQANYRCQVGFRLEGNQRRYCLSNGKWDGHDPSCEIIKCAEPMQVQHAYLIYSDLRYGSVVEYYCDEGYKLKGPIQRICGEDGFWEGDEPYCENIHCQSPAIIDYGDVIVPDTKFGTVISYSCHRGYELHGPSSRICQQDEQWSGKEPKCLPIYCPDHELKLLNGHIKLESNLMGSAVLYSCDIGYELIGLVSRTCQENKEWEGMPPICAKVSCPPPIPPLNGEVVWLNHSFGDSITYSCHKGYILQGDTHRICLPDGTWSNQEPFCEPTKCSSPPNIEFGYVRYDNLNYRSKAKYSCHNGYRLIGSKHIECRANQTWDGEIPQCKQILCPEPPSIQYGHHTTKSFTIGSKATYMCNKGFNLESFELECNPNGRWIGKVPFCKTVNCPIPSKFKFGKIIGKNYTFGNTIHFKCNSGWELIGNSVLICEETGKWNSSYPSCIGTFCPSPEIIHNGQVIATNLKYGTSISYHCNPGYQLIGSDYRTCEVDNTWSGKPPKCLPILCSEISDIIHGTRIGNLFEFGSNVTFICDHGYLLHGASTLQCLENGTWSAAIPICVEVSCSIPEHVKNGEIVVPIRTRQFQKDDSMQADEGFLLGQRGDITINSHMVIEGSQSDIFRLGARVIYKCEKGFHLEGERMRTCQNDGQWSGETPYCKAVSCNNVSSIANGNVSVSSIIFLSEINYTCNNGYRLIGSNKRICLSNGSWSGVSPKCVLIKCMQPPPIPHGKVKWDNLNYGGIAMYECNTGYRLLGNLSRTCQSNEHWSNSEPSCQPLKCIKPANPNNGWVQVDNLVVGSTVKYGCHEGYELSGTMVSTCLMNETWSSVTPSCHIISCVPLPILKYGYIIGSNFTFGSVIKYKCYTGYILKGVMERTCLANKSWSDENPHCQPLNCPRPHAPHHGSVYVPTLSVSSYANYSCYEGYELYGTISRMCMPNLTWSGEVPSCIIINCTSVTTIPYGSVMYTNFTFGSALKFSCLPKYQLSGSEEIWCLPNKKWSSDLPTCNRYICDTLTHDKYSVISPAGPHQIDQVVKFSCITGYKLQGNNILKCDKNGHWEKDIPRCIPIDCDPPPSLTNGRISYLTNNNSNSIHYFYGSKIAYVCNNGYELNGSHVLECGKDGYWVGQIPNCVEVNCGHPPIVHHSTVQVEHLPGLSKAIYICNHGYKLIGSEKHYCKDGKEWNINNTHCEKILCGPSPSFQYSKKVNSAITSYDIGSYVFYVCLPGYKNFGGESLVCSSKSEWIGQSPYCLPINCSKPLAPKHGSVEGDEYTFQSIITYNCDKGYYLVGKDSRECKSNGKWSGSLPECKMIHCDELKEPRNGFLWKEVETRRPIVGDRIWFSCEKGYKMIGSESVQCKENGLWEPNMPTCTVVTCSPPTEFPFKAVEVKYEELFSFGDSLTHICEAGYRADGDLSIKCLENGTWSQPNGVCSKVSCGRPQINNGGVVLGMSYMYRDKVIIKCPPGSKSSGKVVLTCKGDGKWNDEPFCQALCPHPCLNGGYCIPPGVCTCPSGFVGELCQHAICILPCLNGGTCIEPYKCSCEEGFTGSRCEIVLCRPQCQNRGLCIAPNLCRCRINYSGPQCQYRSRFQRSSTIFKHHEFIQ